MQTYVIHMVMLEARESDVRHGENRLKNKDANDTCDSYENIVAFM